MDDKTAQKRKWLNKKREQIGFGGKAMEAFSPELFQIMDKLRTVDDSVRDIAGGKEDNGKTFKDLLRVAETNLKRREYMTAIAYLGRFHERMELINNGLVSVIKEVDNVHHRFLFQDVDPTEIDYITKHLGPRLEKSKSKAKENDGDKKAVLESELVAEAGVKDWLHNIFTDRGRTLAGWEKRFPKYARELKAHTSSMLSRSQSLFDSLLTTLKQLDSFRATRKLEEYLQTAARWIERFRAYNTAFITYYNGQVKRFMEFQKLVEPEKKQESDMDDLFQDKGTVGNGEGAQTEGTTETATEVATEGNAKPPVAGKGEAAKATELEGPATKPGHVPSSMHPELWPDYVPEHPSEHAKGTGEKATVAPKAAPKTETDILKEQMHQIIHRPKEAPKPRPVSLKNPIPQAPVSKGIISLKPRSSPPSSLDNLSEDPYDMTPSRLDSFIGKQDRLNERREPHTWVDTPTMVSHTNTSRRPHTTPPPATRTPFPPSTPFPLMQRKRPHETQRSPLSPASSRIPISTPVSVRDTEREPEMETPLNLLNSNHAEFLNSLEAISSDKPILQAARILKYAAEIETDMPDECERLRALASSILRQ
jgi:hypothetical protein